MNVYEETEMLLKKYKIKANKSLGQNFLISEEVINKIVEESAITKNDLVIEIGPGLGVLTNKMLDKAYKVIAIEIDTKMVDIVKDRFKFYNNIEIINEDILKVNLNELISKEKEEAKINNVEIENVNVIANLPYYISTPIIMKLLEERLEIDNIVVMVQKEVAERLIAKTGSKLAGAITYAVEYYAETEYITEVGKECFIPSPKVESEVIKLKIRKEPKVKVKNEKLLFELIRKCFTQRRKTLANALLNYNFVKDKEEATKVLESLNLPVDIRGENLSLEKFAEICTKLEQIILKR